MGGRSDPSSDGRGCAGAKGDPGGDTGTSIRRWASEITGAVRSTGPGCWGGRWLDAQVHRVSRAAIERWPVQIRPWGSRGPDERSGPGRRVAGRGDVCRADSGRRCERSGAEGDVHQGCVRAGSAHSGRVRDGHRAAGRGREGRRRGRCGDNGRSTTGCVREGCVRERCVREGRNADRCGAAGRDGRRGKRSRDDGACGGLVVERGQLRLHDGTLLLQHGLPRLQRPPRSRLGHTFRGGGGELGLGALHGVQLAVE